MNPPTANDAHGPAAKALSARHIEFIAIGGAIGAGLFVGLGSGISLAGPAILVTYAMCGLVVFFMARALGELTLQRPARGSFMTFAGEDLGPWAAYFTGWSYWLSWVLVAVAELTAIGVLVHFWWPQTPQWLPGVLVLAVLAAANCMQVRLFGEMEFWMSIVKVVTIALMIVSGFVVIAFGVGPGGGAADVANLWRFDGFAPHGWLAVVAAAPMALFAFGGVELVGLTAAEAENPSRSVPRAINGVVIRILVFYIGSIVVVLSLLPWTDVSAAGGSPYVLAFDRIGLPLGAAVVNAVVITAVTSSCNSGIFATGRMLASLSAEGYAPKGLNVLSRSRVPVRAVAASVLAILVGVSMNYVLPDRIFVIVISIVSVLMLWTWTMITVAHLRHRLKVGPGQFRMPAFPFSSWFILGAFVLVLVAMAMNSEARVGLFVGVVWFSGLGIAYGVSRRRAGVAH